MTDSRYSNLQVTADTYVPPVRTHFPEDDPYIGLYQPVYDHPFPEVDVSFPYVDDSFGNRLHIWFGQHFILAILGIILRIKYGLRWRVDGEKKWHRSACSVLRNLKQYDLSGGVITIGNHCYRHDCASILTALGGAHRVRIPMFAPNFKTKDQFFLTAVGGIPIPQPETGLSAMKAFNAAFDEFHHRGHWFHIFPEAKRWDWYKPIRPFQKGAFTMAYKYNMPLLPCVITFRPRTGIYRFMGSKDEPLTQVIIGAPIFPDTSAPRAAETERLRQLTHETMCRLAGITRNTWPAKPEKE